MADRPPPPSLSQAPLAPGLYLVATPIGNLRDVTLRALDVLAAADLILAEDTRVTAKLLSAYGLSRKLERHDEHAAERATPRIVLTLGPEAFTPPPKVASAVVRFLPRAEPMPACSVQWLGRVTAAAFGQRRKMLRQSLRTLIADPLPLLEAVGVTPELRAEQLDVATFARLANAAERLGGSQR